MHISVRVNEAVIVDDAMKEVTARNVSEDVNVDVEVMVDEVVIEDVEDEVQDVAGDLDAVVDAVHNVHADGKVLFCDAAVEEVVVEPPLGDVVADVSVGGKMFD